MTWFLAKLLKVLPVLGVALGAVLVTAEVGISLLTGRMDKLS